MVPDYKGTFNRYKSGSIDLVKTVSGSHVTGDIPVLDLYRDFDFEYEWHISPNQMFAHGEPASVIRWELKKDGNSDIVLTMTHRSLTKATSLRFASRK